MSITDDMKTAQDLIYLVSCAVNNEEADKEKCAEMDLTKVLKSAIRHSLTVAAATALEKAVQLPPSFREEKYKTIRVLSLFDIERKQLLNELEQQKIWYLPLKGIIMREYYPKSSMREMSDNDILYDSSRAADVKAIMEKRGFVCSNYGIYHHDTYKKDAFLKFEMHRTLFMKELHEEWCEHFESTVDRAVRDSGNNYGYHMTDEDFYIFQICHMYKHYKFSGTGLRSLLDVYVFNKRFSDSLDNDYLSKTFKELKVADFERDMRELSEKVFSGKELTDKEQNELSFIVSSNTHGSSENALKLQLGDDDSGKSKRRYILKQIFPTDALTKKKHPLVFRYKVLYPFWVMYRPVKGLLFNRRKMLGDIKRLNNYKKDEKNEGKTFF